MSERTIGPGSPVRAVVVLSARLGGVLPAAAAPLLRAGAPLRADPELPDALREQFGTGGPGEDGLLLTLDASTGEPARWVAAGADVLRTPEPAGSVLLDAVAVMDRLRSPGGCPWDAEQTHASLMPYLIEEAYELYQALEDGDRAALREELGDVLLQVFFHARVAAEAPDGFDVDAVAAELVAKLVGRHPHVFTPRESTPRGIGTKGIDPKGIGTAERVATASDQEVRWEELKRIEKCRESCVDGVALGQPAAALAAELVSRTAKAGLPSDLLPSGAGPGAALFSLAARAKLAGADPEAALRTVARRFGDDVRAAEGSARAAGLDPAGLDPAGLAPEQWRAHWPVRDRSVGGQR